MSDPIKMPTSNVAITDEGRFNPPYQHFVGHIETLDERQRARVAPHVDPETGTTGQIITALIAAGLMEPAP